MGDTRHRATTRADRRAAALAFLAGVTVGLTAVMLTWLTVLATTGTQSPPASTSSSPSVRTPTVAAQPAPAARPKALPDVRTAPAGLFCRDLQARGYPYPAVIVYWRHHREPARMDADGNGIPCETVYPPAAVATYWSP